MTAPIAKTQFSFELPKLSYVDASWEEQTLRASVRTPAKHGFADWLAGRMAAIRAWRERDAALTDLAMMSDRELMDIGLTRSDLPRVVANDIRQNFQSDVA
jgi:uncharacterized protein YjiS (DUF1127 family)